jgi:hypothetical protein
MMWLPVVILALLAPCAAFTWPWQREPPPELIVEEGLDGGVFIKSADYAAFRRAGDLSDEEWREILGM